MRSVSEIRRHFERILPALELDVVPPMQFAAAAGEAPRPAGSAVPASADGSIAPGRDHPRNRAFPATTDRPAFFARLAGVPNVEVCDAAERAGISPYFIESDGLDGPVVRVDGRETLMLGSNNYLGLTRHPAVLAAARDALDRYGSSCTGSRLLNGSIAPHREFEEEIADFLGYPAAILFSTGYQANQGGLAALIRRGDEVFSDRANHASIVDGLGGHGVRVTRYAHNDAADLDGKLAAAPRDRPRIVVADSVFSMTGAVVDLPALMSAARRHGAVVYLDEAHGIGTLGATGRGAAEHFALADRPDLLMGTLSKSLASVGGFLCGPGDAVRFLRHCARSFVFSAAPAPAVIAAGLAALRVLRAEPSRVAAARGNARLLAAGLRSLGFRVTDTPVPVMAVQAADPVEGCTMHAALLQAGVLTNMALYPAVGKGEAMLRVSVMATHTPAHIARALEVFERVGREVGMIGTAARGGGGRRPHGPTPAPTTAGPGAADDGLLHRPRSMLTTVRTNAHARAASNGQSGHTGGDGPAIEVAPPPPGTSLN